MRFVKASFNARNFILIFFDKFEFWSRGYECVLTRVTLVTLVAFITLITLVAFSAWCTSFTCFTFVAFVAFSASFTRSATTAY